MRPNRILLSSLLIGCLAYSSRGALALDDDNDNDLMPTTTTTAAAATSTSGDSGQPTAGAPTTASTSAAGTPPAVTTAPSTTTSSTAPPPKPAKRPADCPPSCACTQKAVDCQGRGLQQLPKFDAKSSFVEFRFANNNISALDFRLLPLNSVELVDLSDNGLKTVAVAPARKNNELGRLRVLLLRSNTIQLAQLSTWKMPNLEELDLSMGAIEKLAANDFAGRPNLKRLNLSAIGHSAALDEFVFAPLVNLRQLNLVQAFNSAPQLPDQLFVKNQQLETLDLSRNELPEIPAALRLARGLKNLTLNWNSLTSLRPSAFINHTKLERVEVRHCAELVRVESATFADMPKLSELLVSDNPKFVDFSRDAFERPTASGDKQPPLVKHLALLDLSNNNITTMSSPISPSVLSVQSIKLAGNPWDCSCTLEWLVKVDNLARQQPIHCKTPLKYQDIEMSEFFLMRDCELEESSTQKFVLVLFLLFLILLTVAVFVQKTDICRRLQWRDQYGTIYYTKASFPTEQV